MKIGILTSSIAGNYGGILQNYALQHVLKGMGHTPMAIDHYKPYSRVRWCMGRIKGYFKKQPTHVPFPFYGRVGSKRILDFAFKHILRTRPIKQFNHTIVDNYHFFAIIVGSDQVWRYKSGDQIENFYLSFIESLQIKRVAFSASFGVEKWNYPIGETKRCKHLLRLFDAVSVREKSDVQLCRENLGIEPKHTLDPTLLLDKDVYIKLCNNVPLKRNNFLFAYLLDPTPQKLNEIKLFAHKIGLLPLIRYAENNSRKEDGVEDWLACFRDATYVVTDSYHGTLFSIIFQKEFITINNTVRGQSRFKSILEELGLTERLISFIPNELTFDPIDWKLIKNIILNRKNESLSFLEKALKE